MSKLEERIENRKNKKSVFSKFKFVFILIMISIGVISVFIADYNMNKMIANKSLIEYIYFGFLKLLNL